MEQRKKTNNELRKEINEKLERSGIYRSMVSTWIEKHLNKKGYSEASVSIFMKENIDPKKEDKAHKKLLNFSQYISDFVAASEESGKSVNTFFQRFEGTISDTKDKTSFFLDTTWAVYYRKDSSTLGFKGMGRGFLSIGNNSKSIYFKTGGKTEYPNGEIKMMKLGAFITLLFINDFDELVFQVIGGVGPKSTPELFLGTYNTITRRQSMVSGIMVFIRKDHSFTKEEAVKEFKEGEKLELNEEEQTCWDYFQNSPCKNHIKIPSTLLSMHSFQKYMKQNSL